MKNNKTKFTSFVDFEGFALFALRDSTLFGMGLFLVADGSETSPITFLAMRFKPILGSTLDEFVGGFFEFLEFFLAGDGDFEPLLVVVIYRRREHNGGGRTYRDYRTKWR